jgi:dTDP-4-dehydrorhamnose 3,5-epimerase-like enzyme
MHLKNNKIKIVKLKQYRSDKGLLIPVSFLSSFATPILRVFFIFANKGNIRGEHAHKLCSQIFTILIGKVKLIIIGPSLKKKIYYLNEKNIKSILIPPLHWCRLEFLKKSIVSVACDQEYKFNDYIETFQEFLKKIK